jgi:hypothetical protein
MNPAEARTRRYAKGDGRSDRRYCLNLTAEEALAFEAEIAVACGGISDVGRDLLREAIEARRLRRDGIC